LRVKREEDRIFRYFFDRCDFSKVDPYSALYYCVLYGGPDLVQYVLDSGSIDPNHLVTYTENVNYKHVEKQVSMLSAATKYNRIDTVKLLLDYGADKNYVDANGKTAYDYINKDDSPLYDLLLPDIR
jgi:ankyrin repeat protein